MAIDFNIDGTKVPIKTYIRNTRHLTERSLRIKKMLHSNVHGNPQNRIRIEKEGFEAAINKTYGLIIPSANGIYLAFSDKLDPLLDKTQKQLPDNFYDLLFSGKSCISENVSKNGIPYYKTGYLYSIFGGYVYNITHIDSDNMLFKIAEVYDPLCSK